MRKLFGLLFLLLWTPLLYAQQQTVTGTISTSGTDCSTAGACVVMNLTGAAGSVSFTISGALSATLQFEVAVVGQTPVSVNCFPPNSTTGVSSTTSAGTWTCGVAGMNTFDVRASARASGTPTVTITQSAATAASTVTGGGGGGVTSIATTAPLGGGTITTTGTLTCTTCVTSSSPGAGIAHFAGSTQAVTSSAVALASDVSGQLPIGSVGSAGLSGTAPIGIAATGAISLTQSGVTAAGATISPSLIDTNTNCAAAGSGANPSLVACSAAPAGSFSCATNASTGTCVISTTAVTANSRIFVQPSAAEGSNLSVTCNTTADTGLLAPRIASKSASTSFTINLGTFATNPLCFNYWIVN